MRFEWDERKNDENIFKHDLDFEDAAEVFAGPVLKRLDTRQDYGEARWIGIGLLGVLVVVVVFTPRPPDMIRIISMRKATQYERQRFEAAFQDELEGPEPENGRRD